MFFYFDSFFVRVGRSATPKNGSQGRSGMGGGEKKLQDIMEDMAFGCVMGLQMVFLVRFCLEIV